MSTSETIQRTPKLSKLQLRQAAANAFTGFRTYYTERSDAKKTYGKLTIGRSDIELSCNRGGEVWMRVEFMGLMESAHKGVSELVEGERG